MIAALLLPALAAQVPAPVPQDPLAGAWEFGRAGGVDFIVEEDAYVYVVERPTFKKGHRRLEATWAVFWLDRAAWDAFTTGDSSPGTGVEELRASADSLRESGATVPLIPTLFAEIDQSLFADTLKELYLEGPIEYFIDGERQGFAGALYLDMVDGHGWIADVNLSVERQYRGERFQLRAQAQWMRHSADGSLHADSATVTTCEFDDPHIHVTTEDLRVTPFQRGDEVFFRVDLEDNSINMYDFLKLPLPSYEYDADEEGRPVFDAVRAGDDARFGTFLRAGISGDLGSPGATMNTLLGGRESYDSDLNLSASYLSSRGGLIDVGFELSSPGVYTWETYVALVLDTGRDRGIVRVDEDDRSTLRRWYRSSGRYLLERDEWVDMRFSIQSDAAVQSEFFEGDFLRYEERETYLHYRNAKDEDYFSGTVKVRTDDFRTQVEQLPSLEYSRLRASLGTVAGTEVVYSASASAAYLRRREGDDVQGLYLDQPFPDGLGEREGVRVGTTHRLEAPFSLGFAGLRASPFVELRGTLWTEAIDEDVDDSPTQAAGIGGVQLATTLRRPIGASHYVELAPFVRARSDFFFEEHDGEPVPFARQQPIVEGDVVEVGVRGRWLPLGPGNRLDVELRGTHASDVGDGFEEGWQPIGLFATLDTTLFDVPVEFFEDMRYDIDDAETVYALTAVGFDLTENLRLVLGHRYGRDFDRDTLFEAASIAARYRWSEKWELEGEQVISVRSGGDLDTSGTVRRFGHDFVFEIEVSERAGEGTSISFSVRPRLGWDPSRLGGLGL